MSTGLSGSNDEFGMDYDAVHDMAARFNTSAQILNAVNTALRAVIEFLEATSFLGLVGNRIMIRYLENIVPKIETLQATCAEMHDDLEAAVRFHEEGDESVSQKFVHQT